MKAIRQPSRRTTAALLLTAATLAAPAVSRAAPPAAGPDAVAVQKAMQANELLIRLAETAQGKAQSEEVRRYAKRAHMDHGFALDKLAEIAAEHDLAAPAPHPAASPSGAPSGPGAKMQGMAQKLEHAPADRFDAQYLHAMVKVHGQLRQQLSQAATKVEVPELRELIENLIPILGQHEDLARAILSDLGETNDAASPAGR